MSSSWIRPEKRHAIYARDGYACVYCGIPAEESDLPITLDHVVARELGGSNEATNLVTSCHHCNSSKQALTLRQFFVVLRDRGVDTAKIGRRIRRLTAKAIDIKLGRKLVAARREG